MPDGAICLRSDLVPAVREFLSRGLTEKFQKGCVRIGGFNRYSGGLKADLVGGLRIDVRAALKIGTTELIQHRQMMRYVNGVRPKTFPDVLGERSLADGRVMLITEDFTEYVTLLNKVYHESTRSAEFERIVGHVCDALGAMHSLSQKSAPALRSIPVTPEPFMARLHEKFSDIVKSDPDLHVILDRPGEIMQCPCLPAGKLLDNAAIVAKSVAETLPLRLVHGDPHFANIMVRKSGKNGYRVRLIDPNPLIGFSQPLYDYGKLMHWCEPVGWAKVNPSVCRAKFLYSKKKRRWNMAIATEGISQAAENRRRSVWRLIHRSAQSLRQDYGEHFDFMLSIATASSHIGLAAFLNERRLVQARRFVVAHTMKRLAISSNGAAPSFCM